jgi:hypothetical protein
MVPGRKKGHVLLTLDDGNEVVGPIVVNFGLDRVRRGMKGPEGDSGSEELESVDCGSEKEGPGEIPSCQEDP